MREQKRGYRLSKNKNYFYYNGEAHRVLRIDRRNDVVVAWSYIQGKIVKYIYSDVRKYGSRCYSTAEAAVILNRSVGRLKNLLSEVDGFPRPVRTYGLDDNRNPFQFIWGDDDIYAANEWLAEHPRGRPPKNGGLANSKETLSRAELRARLNHQQILYVKTEDGEFVPTWEANRF